MNRGKERRAKGSGIERGAQHSRRKERTRWIEARETISGKKERKGEEQIAVRSRKRSGSRWGRKRRNRMQGWKDGKRELVHRVIHGYMRTRRDRVHETGPLLEISQPLAPCEHGAHEKVSEVLDTLRCQVDFRLPRERNIPPLGYLTDIHSPALFLFTLIDPRVIINPSRCLLALAVVRPATTVYPRPAADTGEFIYQRLTYYDTRLLRAQTVHGIPTTCTRG